MEIYRCPRYLIFQIKRFRQGQTGKVKNDAKVDFPIQLDMKPFTLDHRLPETYFLDKEGTDFVVEPEYYKERKIN